MIVSLILAILTIGAVSAADDADALAADDAIDEQVIEAPVADDEVLAGDIGDFNVTIAQLFVFIQFFLCRGNRNDPNTDQHCSQYHNQEFLHLSFLLLYIVQNISILCY